MPHRIRRLLAATTLIACSAGLSIPIDAAAFGTPSSLSGAVGRQVIDSGWQFRADPGDVGLDEGWSSDRGDEGWSDVSVPHTWNANDLSAASMAGTVGWYRVKVPAPDPTGYPRMLLDLEGVGGRSTVWLNGTLAGQSDLAYLPVHVVLKDWTTGENWIVIRIDSRRTLETLPPRTSATSRDQPFPEGWWNWGGLIREVQWWPINRADVDAPVVQTQVGEEGATVTVRASATNHSTSNWLTLAGTLDGVDLPRKVVWAPIGSKWRADWTVSVGSDRLWSPADPKLVDVKIDAVDAKRNLDSWVGKSGLREVRVADGRIRVNGNPLKLWGVNLHEESPEDGASLTPDQQDSLIDQAASLGANVIRSHYPLSPRMLERADRLGLLVWEEVPLWQPSKASLDSPVFRERSIAYLEQMVRRDRAHPSVLLWSIGNEFLSSTLRTTLSRHVAAMAAKVRLLDPSRPLGVALFSLTASWKGWEPLDVVGVNNYFGWYSRRTSDLPSELARMRRVRPAKQAVLLTEFGAESVAGLDSGRGSYAFQSSLLDDTFKYLAASASLSGGLVWTLRDFACRPGWTGGNTRAPTPPFNNKGLFTRSGEPKPAAEVVRGWFTRLNGG